MALTTINRPDSQKALFGTGDDLELYHDGSHNYLKSSNGRIYAQGIGRIQLQVGDGTNWENSIVCYQDGSTDLYYNNSKKFETTDVGVQATGHIFSTTKFRGNDDVKVSLGTSEDLQLYHDGSNSYISDTGTGSLKIRGDVVEISATNAEQMILATADAGVNLYYNSSKKFETTSDGVKVIGDFNLDNGTNAGHDILWDESANNLRWSDSVKAQFGNSADLSIYHDGSNTFIEESGTGSLFISSSQVKIRNAAVNEEMIVANENGAVELYYDNAKKLSTTSEGIDLTHSSNNQRLIRLSHPTSPSNAAGFLGFNSDGTTDNNIVTFGCQYSDTYYDVLNIKRSTRNVGIGTTNPDTLLHLSGADTAVIRLENTDTSLAADQVIGGLEFEKQDGSGAGAGVVGGLRMYSGVDGITTYLTLSTSNSSNNNVEALRITSDRNVQIDNDSGKFQVGDGQDLSIYHDGTKSYIVNNTGNLELQNGAREIGLKVDTVTFKNGADNEYMAAFYANGTCKLYYDNAEKFETTSSGVTVTGNLNLGDNNSVKWGDGNDLNIWHDGSNSYIKNSTNALTIQGGAVYINDVANGKTSAGFDTDGSVSLYYDNTKILETLSSGVDITGWIRPTTDNYWDVGHPDYRWDDIRASNSSIVTSDKNEKNTIVDSDLGLSFVNKLKPVSYKFNGKTRTHYGLIAQDVETVITDLGKTTTQFAPLIKDKLEDGTERYGLRYGELIAPLIKSIQELSTEIKTLKTKVAALEAA